MVLKKIYLLSEQWQTVFIILLTLSLILHPSSLLGEVITWSPTGSMKESRSCHTATLLPNGKVLVAGGLSNVAYFSKTAELYDPATGQWTLTGSMATDRFFHTATLLINGKVLVTGGNY